MNASISTESISMTTSQATPVSAPSSIPSSTPTNPVPTSMLSFRFATPNNAKTPYYISSDIVLSGGIAQQNRRRIVHNEVEKRRKDKITNWIKKLAALLPRHRVLKQSKNYVLESACEYIEELRERSSQFGSLKTSKQKLEQQVAALKNRVNKLEDENKRLSQLIRQHNVAIPTTWSDSSAITATIRATSSPRHCDTEPRPHDPDSRTPAAGWNPPAPSRTSATSGASHATTVSATNRLSVTSILSNTSHHQSESTSGLRIYTVSGSVSTAAAAACSQTPVTNTITRSVLPSTVLAVAVTPATSISSTTNSREAAAPTTNMCTGNLQPLIVAQVQPVAGVSSNILNQTPQFAAHQTMPIGFASSNTLRSNAAQHENISQLPYSIDALTGNQTSSRAQPPVAAGQLLNFSAESLISRHGTPNEIVMMNNAANQPVIENTFTLSHPTTLTNATPHSSSPPQTFSNFSALSLVGSTAPFTVSSSGAPARSAEPATPSISHSTNQMFTDFSTESLIASNEFSSDFAIDNLISRSDSNVHMAAVNPNLIQSFGKANDPLISSVCGDHQASAAINEGVNQLPASSYLPFGNSFANLGQATPRPQSDQPANVALCPTFSTILSPPLFSRPLDGSQRHTVNSTNFFSGSFPTPFQVS